MIKKLKARRITKTNIGSKLGIVDLRKNIIENKTYSLSYTIKGKSLELNFLKRYRTSNLGDFKKIYSDLLNIAKEKKIKRIYTSSWIFSETKGLSERLGFKLVKGTDKKLKLIKEKYPDYKIIGIEQRFSTDSINYGVIPCLVLENKSLKKEVTIILEKNMLPIYVKEL
ncbi:hypothetical protein M0P25_02835 [archaeon]|nr:hypothetical protein [archaeon]MDD3084693.1 hypothetical protein [Candidatus ainarchaeum sp.]